MEKATSQNPLNLKPATTTIESLPADVLVRIFHTLCWPDRVRGAGAVCRLWHNLMLTRGWADVRHFDTRETLLRVVGCTDGDGHQSRRCPSNWLGPLLDRFGSVQLTSLTLDEVDVPREELLPLYLGKCPKLLHLQVGFNATEKLPGAIEHIRNSAFATSLKSLHIECREWDGGALVAINEALDHGHFASLECLQLEEWASNHNDSTEISLLRLPPAADSLANLRHVTLQGPHLAPLSAECVEVLASLPWLSSLSFGGNSNWNLSFLQRFTRLEHLCVGHVGPTNQGSLIEAFPHLAGHGLKALEVLVADDDDAVDDDEIEESTKELLTSIAADLPELEHLSVDCVSTESCSQLFPTLLGKLRSLVLGLGTVAMEMDDEEIAASWHWLSEMTRLEYLGVPHDLAPPHATLCELVRNCKSLHSIDLYGYSPSVEEQQSLADAAGAHANTLAEPINLPLLLVKVAVDCGADCNNELEVRGSRLRFTEDMLSSQVLLSYKYGHLSEGKPSFAWN